MPAGAAAKLTLRQREVLASSTVSPSTDSKLLSLNHFTDQSRVRTRAASAHSSSTMDMRCYVANLAQTGLAAPPRVPLAARF